MAIAQSKVTAQGQISVPAEIRRKLGVGPGSILEWDEQSGQIIVRKAGRFTSADVHSVLFGSGEAPRTPASVKDGIKGYVRRKHARD